LKKLFLFFIVFANLSFAETPAWTQEQQAWGATAGVLMLADWTTTRYGTRHWDEGYYENNLILGKQPSTDRLNLYFLVAIPAVYLAADAFPEHRTLILQIVSGIELVAVGNNLRIGWKLSF
jgi:hypothetical protein